MNRNSLIPISALLSFGAVTLADINDHNRLPTGREYLGLCVVFTVLSAGVDLNIPVAGGFAVLVMVAVLLSKGESSLEFLMGKLNGNPKKQGRETYAPKPYRPKNPNQARLL